MNAVLSGRAGIAVIRDGKSCFCLDHDAEDWVECSAEEDVWRVFGECRDFEFLEQTEHVAVRARLKDAVVEADALDLALTLLDNFQYTDDTLATAAEELEERLNRDVRIAVEKVLFASPLPESVDLERSFSYVQSYPKAKAFLAALLDLQPSIRVVNEAWLSVPISAFAEPADREVFQHFLMRAGVFRDSVLARQNAMAVSALVLAMTLEPIKRLKNHHEVLTQWAKPLDETISVRRSEPEKVPNSRERKKTSKRKIVQKARAVQVGAGPPAEPVERNKYDAGAPIKDLSVKAPKELPKGYGKDRIVCLVRDPYWLHVYWEVTRRAVQRAEAALGKDWHLARPILRLLDVSESDTASASEAFVQDINIHGASNNWYIDVANPPRSYRVDIGYFAMSGQFYVLARSNVVTTARAGLLDTIDESWADIDLEKADKIFAMNRGFDPGASGQDLKHLFEERLRRPQGSPSVTSFGSGAFQFSKERKFRFQLDAELIVYGATEPTANVTLHGEAIKLRHDGTFTMRFSLPDCRQVIPAVAASADGVEERTIVLTVERNTKILEPVINKIADAENRNTAKKAPK